MVLCSTIDFCPQLDVEVNFMFLHLTLSGLGIFVPFTNRGGGEEGGGGGGRHPSLTRTPDPLWISNLASETI